MNTEALLREALQELVDETELWLGTDYQPYRQSHRVRLKLEKARAALAHQEPADPMDWPLPCDVTVGHGTISKGCKLRTLVMRMRVLYDMAIPKVTPEQAAANLAELQARAHQPQEQAAQVFGLPFAEAKKRILKMSESDVRGLAISLLIQANGARPPALLDFINRINAASQEPR